MKADWMAATSLSFSFGAISPQATCAGDSAGRAGCPRSSERVGSSSVAIRPVNYIHLKATGARRKGNSEFRTLENENTGTGPIQLPAVLSNFVELILEDVGGASTAGRAGYPHFPPT